MTRKTAELYVVYLAQDGAGKAEPYRGEWQEMPMVGGARVALPPSGRIDDTRELLRGEERLVWFNFGLSTSPKAGAPCVALGLRPRQFWIRKGDFMRAEVFVGASRDEGPGNTFGVMNLIDFGEFNRRLHLMIAALPAIWKVKRAPKL